MAETSTPDAAVQIAAEAVADTEYEDPAEHIARVLCDALAHAGWLHDPAEVAALRAVVEAARAYVPHVESGEKFDALLTTLDAAPAAAETTGLRSSLM